MAHNIADLTLDQVIVRLIAGETLQVSGGGDFTLSVVDSRAILSFYNQDRRAYWNPDKDTAIQDGEIDKVLEALERAPKATAFPSRAASTAQKWHLVSIEAHRSVACTATARRRARTRSRSSCRSRRTQRSFEGSTAPAKPR